ncbi:MAG: metal-dependent transcriptional regulator [Dissulfurispiraceae bacterium]|jgi:DtxR family Mn-dependent transcriptional regulator|nr:metal-dependent transcriptional regulator [Dissulfurispiraceae bacterium]
MNKERIDEALEFIWRMEELNESSVDYFKAHLDDTDPAEVLDELIAKAYIIVVDNGLILTGRGRELAKGVVRRHRLAERLFVDVFDLPKDSVHADACRIEHILSEELTDSVCTFLGHPTTSPNGGIIPRGDCCIKNRVDVKPVVTRLFDFEVGRRCKIHFITPSEAAVLGRLSSIGIVPGAVIKLIQKKPSVVIQVDETTIAIDSDLAKEIFVKRVID